MSNRKTIGDNGVNASIEDLSVLTRDIKEIFKRDCSRPAIDLHNEDSVTNCIIEYFDDCERVGKRPANMGLYRALGVSRQDINNAIMGYSRRKISPNCLDIIKKALQLISEYREQLGMQGKLHPTTMIFWQKNYDGLEDYTRLEIQPSVDNEAMLSPEQVRAALDIDRIQGDND